MSLLKEKIQIPGKEVEDRIKYLFDNPLFMKGHYLGDLFESTRWGSQTTTMWELSAREMTRLSSLWMSVNANDLPKLFFTDENQEKPHIPSFGEYHKRAQVFTSPRSKRTKEGETVSLQEVFNRLDFSHVGGSYISPDRNFVTVMDGHDLATYVGSWYLQKRNTYSPIYTD